MIPRLFAFLLVLAPARGAVESVNGLPFADDCVLRTWEVADGLGDNHISGIARGPEGYLWVTNFTGLFRFDGVRFVHVDRSIAPGLPSPWVAPVFSARDGALWLGLERGGVARWSKEKMDTIAPVRPRPTPEVWPWSFAEEARGAVWFGTAHETRASRFFAGDAATYSTADGLPGGGKTMIRVAGDGTVWAATALGCALFDGRRFHAVEPEAGGMWTIRGGRLLRYDSTGARLETLAPPWLPAIEQINALHEDGGGALWIGTRDFGLLRFRDGMFERIRTSFDNISFLAEDAGERLWAGTWGGGLDRLSPRHFFLRQVWPERPQERPHSLCEDAEGRLWILGRSGGPVRALDGEGRSFSPVAGWPAEVRANVVCADADGNVWLGTVQGLQRWREGRLTPTSLSEPVAALFAARDGTLWGTTGSGGLFRHRGGELAMVDGVRQVRAMAEDASGRLWVGTAQGTVFLRERDAFVPVALPGAGAEETVRFIVQDGRDTMWIGTLLGGLYRWQRGEVARVSNASGVSLAEVRALLIERRGPPGSPAEKQARDVFWIGTATGLLRVVREDLEGFLDGDRATLSLMHCGSNEGLPAVEFMERGQSTAIRTRSGRLWFITNRGLLEIQSGAASEAVSAARVLIEDASAGPGALVSTGSAARAFPPRPDAVRIRYTLPEVGSPELVRFRYRLDDGAGDGGWIDAGRQREATFVRPGPGRYRFEVAAAIGDGPWLSPAAALEFSVTPAWWQTGIFRGAVALVLAAGITAAAREVVMRRMRARIRRIKQAHAIERERARIARDMHDELGANLTLIAAMARFSAEAPAGEARQLGEIEATARQTVESLDEIVWAVNPRNDTVAGTVEYVGKFAAGFLAKAGIEAGLAWADALSSRHVSAESRHHLFLAIKECLNNAVKHSAATSVRLEAKEAPESLEIVVADNGLGLARGAVDRFSNGLANMQERMAGIGGTCRVEDRAEGGCRVVFTLPLRGEKPAGNSA